MVKHLLVLVVYIAPTYTEAQYREGTCPLQSLQSIDGSSRGYSDQWENSTEVRGFVHILSLHDIWHLCPEYSPYI